MRQYHPLENPSLAPYGFVFPRYQKRLEYVPKGNSLWINAEKLIARRWDRWNRLNAPRRLPVETIIHEILPSQKRANHLVSGDFKFRGLPYLTRDILVLSAVVQWFGTNQGRCFLEDLIISLQPIRRLHSEREFLIKFSREMKHRDMVAFWTHVCTPRCETVRSLWHDGCYYNSKAVSPRDRAVVDGLMRWLGSGEGRAFAAEYSRYKKRAQDAAYALKKKERAATAT